MGRGERRLKQALARRRRRSPRRDRPRPYDENWGWWMEDRLGRVETQIKWLVGLAATTLATEVLRVLTSSWRP
jgi:hypothetical protein